VAYRGERLREIDLGDAMMQVSVVKSKNHGVLVFELFIKCCFYMEDKYVFELAESERVYGQTNND